jgi:acyl carrier protein
MDRQQIIEVIYRAIDDLNAAQPADAKIDKSPVSVLFGQGGKLDSLGLMTLILQVEQHAQESIGRSVSLTDERAMADSGAVFRTVGTLADYILACPT